MAEIWWKVAWNLEEDIGYFLSKVLPKILNGRKKNGIATETSKI